MPNFVLVDFENVQPRDLALLRESQVRVFLGPHQTRIPVSLAASLQPLGTNVEYVSLETPGKNALDFQMAYHLGHLAATNPAASFQIVSKDCGFDPLIEHLRARGVRIERSSSLGDHKPGHQKPGYHKPGDQKPTRIDRAVEFLKKRNRAMPRTEKALLASLRNHFHAELSEAALAALVASLKKRGIVKIEGKTLSFHPPSQT